MDARQKALDVKVGAMQDRLVSVERGRNLRAGANIEVNGAQVGAAGGSASQLVGAANSNNQYVLQSVNVSVNGLPATQQLVGLPPVLV